MASEYNYAPLSSLCHRGPDYGANAKAVTFDPDLPRYIRITDINDRGQLISSNRVSVGANYLNESMLHESDVLFARSGNTVGKTYLHTNETGPTVFAGYLIRFSPTQSILNPKFLFYYTMSPEYKSWILSNQKVGGQPNISGKEYSHLPIPLPHPKEQNKIVEILNQGDALRQKRVHANDLSSRLLPAIFRAYFGEISSNSKKWDVTSLESLIEIEAPFVKPETGVFDHLPHIGADCIEKETGRLLDWKSVKEDGVFSGKFHFDSRDVLYTKIRPYLKKVALPEFEGLCSADIYPLRPKAGKATREFIWALLLSDVFTNYTSSVSARANMPKINKDQLFGYQTISPDFTTQQAFSQRISELRHIVSNAESSTTQLETLFKVLLQKAFDGRLTTSWREAHAKELLQEMEIQAGK